jgi:anti-anti-sigma regulatory factor
MLKITVHDTAGQLRLELAGRLAGAWVCELEQCWHTARANHLHRPLTVDLTSVTFIDQAGRYLLQLMHHDNVRFVTSSLMWHDLIDHITGAMG